MLVSALGSPSAEGDNAAEQPAEATSDDGGGSPAAHNAAAEDSKAGILQPAAATAGTDSAPFVKEEEPQVQQVGRVGAGDSAEAVTEVAPAAVRTAAAPPEQKDAASMGASDATAGTKRRLDNGTGEDGPPLVKIKREQQ